MGFASVTCMFMIFSDNLPFLFSSLESMNRLCFDSPVEVVTGFIFGKLG